MIAEKWALITGASAGIGEATARALAQKSCNLILLARRHERIQALKSELEAQYGVQCVAAALDIKNKEAVLNFIQNHQSQLESLDILINNAGLARSTSPISEVPLDDIEEMIDTNVTGLIRLTHGVLPFLQNRQSAHIINLGSVAGRWVYPGGAVYCATKFAIRALSEGLRMDLLGQNIRVTNIEPGMVETEFSAVRLRDAEKAKSVYKGMTPLTPQDIAETILWCLERPSHVNVQELVIYPTDQASVSHVNRRNT